MRIDYRQAIAIVGLVLGGWSAADAQPAAPPNRAARDTWTPVMSVLDPARKTAVTPAQLQRLAELPVEALWGALQTRQYVRSFEGGFQYSVANPKIVGP